MNSLKQKKNLKKGFVEIIRLSKKAKKLCRRWNRKKSSLSKKEQIFFFDLHKYSLIRFKTVFGRKLAVVAKSIPLPFPFDLS